MFRKKIAKLVALMPLAISPAFIAISCGNNFDNNQNIIDADFEFNIIENAKKYNSNFERLKQFMDKSDAKNFKSYYFDKYQKIKSIVDFWGKEFFSDSYGKVIKIFNNEDATIKKEDLKISILEIDSDGNIKEDWANSPDKELFNFVNDNFFDKASDNDKVPYFLRMKYLKLINDEMDSILNDYSVFIPTKSVIYQFDNLFNNSNYDGWPLFKQYGKNLSQEYKEIFFDDIKKYTNRLFEEYKNKYFDITKEKIDYSKLISGNIDANQNHTHATINLWREWSSTVQKDDSKTNFFINTNSFINLFNSILSKNNINQSGHKLIYKIINTKNNSELFSLEMINFFNNYENIIKANKIETSEAKIKEFENNFLLPINNMKSIAREISDLVQEYEQ